MNGASADPCAKTSNAPRPTRTIMTGSSQNFLRTRMKPQSSPTNPRCATKVSVLELTFHALAIGHGRHVRFPAGLGASARDDRRVATQPADQADGQDDKKIDDAHEDGGRHLRDRFREPHPGALDRAERGRRDERRDDEEPTDREEHGRRAVLPAPPRDPPEDEERRADGEPELAAVGRAQSSWNSRCHAWSSF